MRNNYTVHRETYNFSGRFRTIGATYPFFQAYCMTKRERDRFLALHYHSPGEITLNAGITSTSTSNNSHLTTYNILRGIKQNVEDHQGIIQNPPLGKDLPININSNDDIVSNNVISLSNEIYTNSSQTESVSVPTAVTLTITEPTHTTENSSVRAEGLLIDPNFEETVQNTTISDGLSSNADEHIEIAGEFEVNPNLLEAWHVTHNSWRSVYSSFLNSLSRRRPFHNRIQQITPSIWYSISIFIQAILLQHPVLLIASIMLGHYFMQELYRDTYELIREVTIDVSNSFRKYLSKCFSDLANFLWSDENRE